MRNLYICKSQTSLSLSLSLILRFFSKTNDWSMNFKFRVVIPTMFKISNMKGFYNIWSSKRPKANEKLNHGIDWFSNNFFMSDQYRERWIVPWKSLRSKETCRRPQTFSKSIQTSSTEFIWFIDGQKFEINKRKCDGFRVLRQRVVLFTATKTCNYPYNFQKWH